MIRVTPIGGEPVELPEETACFACIQRYAGFRILVAQPVDDEYVTVALPTGELEHRTASTLGSMCDYGVARCFTHIGDAWPLCTVETWRQRAERLERELVALRKAIGAAQMLTEFQAGGGLLFNSEELE